MIVTVFFFDININKEMARSSKYKLGFTNAKSDALFYQSEIFYSSSLTNEEKAHLLSLPSNFDFNMNRRELLLTLFKRLDNLNWIHSGTGEFLIEHQGEILYPVNFEQDVPRCVSRTYSRFALHVNKSEELKGLKYIGIVRFSMRKDDRLRTWYHTENPNTYGENQKEFSCSMSLFPQLMRTDNPLENDRDRWLFLFSYGSKMTERDVDRMFGDELMFRGIFQILKLDNLTEDERQEYYCLEKIRRHNEDCIRSVYEEHQDKQAIEKLWKEGLNLSLDEVCQRQKKMLKFLRKKGYSTEIIDFFIQLSDENIEKLRQDINKKANAEALEKVEEKKKQTIMDAFKNGISVQDLTLLAHWSEHGNIKRMMEEIENQESMLRELEPTSDTTKCQIEVSRESQQLIVEDELTKEKPP
jgi:hypothetical protein